MIRRIFFVLSLMACVLSLAVASPTLPWEKFGGREILEGPEFLAGKKDEVFIVYSASACRADEYALGMLVAQSNSDLLDPVSANTGAGQGCDHRRSPRLQQFSWKKDGRTDFGVPVKIDSALRPPTAHD